MQSRVPTTDEMRRRLEQLRAGKKVEEASKEELVASANETKKPPAPSALADPRKLPQHTKNLMLQVLQAENFDPIMELIDLYRHGDLKDSERASILKDMIPYIAPKLKQTESHVSVKGEFTVLLQDFSSGKTIDISDLTQVDEQTN